MSSGAGPVSKRDTGHVGEKRDMAVKIMQEPSHRSTIVQTGDGRKGEAMQGKRQGNESGAKSKRKAEVLVDLVRNSRVKRDSMGAQQRLEGEARSDARNEALDDKAAQESER